MIWLLAAWAALFLAAGIFGVFLAHLINTGRFVPDQLDQFDDQTDD